MRNYYEKALEDFSLFAAQYPRLDLDAGQSIIQIGDEPEYVYGVIDGFIKISDFSTNGQEQFIWIAKRYDIVPLEMLIEQSRPSLYNYSAFTKSSVVRVPVAEFNQFVSDKQDVLKLVLTAIIEKQQQLLMQLNAVKKPTAYEKVIFILVYLAGRFGNDKKNGNEELSLPITHQDVADMLGLNRKTVTQALKKLADAHVIYYDPTSFLVRPARLLELTN